MTLDEIGIKHGTDKASTHHGYLNYYQEILGHFRNTPITLVEIGVQFGFSIKTWLDYFKNAEIHGVDVANDFKTDNPRYHFWQHDQGNKSQWQSFINAVKRVDVVIDDGNHRSDSQKATFECLWPILRPSGIYIIEDWFTTYDPAFYSSISGRDWLGNLIGDLNWNGKDYYGKPGPRLPVSDYEKSIASITLRRGLVVLRKP